MITIKFLKKIFINSSGTIGFTLQIENLVLNENEIVYIIGPNGSGKTVFASLLIGQLNPDDGNILIHDKDISSYLDLFKFSNKSRSKYFGYVPQDNEEILCNELSIKEHLIIALDRCTNVPFFFPKKKTAKKISDYLTSFNTNLTNRINESVANLSGGERQLLNFFLATIHNPSCLILDEFISSLDTEMRKMALDYTFNFIKQSKSLTLIITHDIAEAAKYANRIIIFNRGMIIADLSKSEIAKMSKKDDEDQFTIAHINKIIGDVY